MEATIRNCSPAISASTLIGNLIQKPTKRITAGGFVFVERIPAVGLEIPLHFHEAPSLWYVSKGCCLERTSRCVIEHAPFDIIFAAGGEAHATQYSSGAARTVEMEIHAAQYQEPMESFLRVSGNSDSLRTPKLKALAIQVYREL